MALALLSLASAFSTLIRFPLGDFKYDELFYARPGLAVIFFGLYVIMVFIVCLNMFIGKMAALGAWLEPGASEYFAALQVSSISISKRSMMS